jgi:hypothetical protein
MECGNDTVVSRCPTLTGGSAKLGTCEVLENGPLFVQNGPLFNSVGSAFSMVVSTHVSAFQLSIVGKWRILTLVQLWRKQVSDV